MAQRVAGFQPSIFSVMTSLAREHNAVNLGQGFPDFPAPDFVKEAAIRAIHGEINQYAPSAGLPVLRAAVAAAMGAAHGWRVDPGSDVVVTAGATEAIFATVMGLVNPGDEVVLFEPFYDSYLPAIQFAGGVPRVYTLQPPEWAIDPQRLAALFSARTRLVIVNTPHNPTGKVFTSSEMDLLGRLCQEHDAIALVDAVYEHIIFDDAHHHCLATWPGMAARTVYISSMGKTFSVTGWKIGWAVAAAPLADAILRAHQFITFCSAAPLQAAAAWALTQAVDSGYYAELAALYQARRDLLFNGLRDAGLAPIAPQGTYFIMVDLNDLPFADDVAFCRYLTTEVGVAAIPPSAFYQLPANGAGLARFAFCKSDAELALAIARLRAWRGG